MKNLLNFERFHEVRDFEITEEILETAFNKAFESENDYLFDWMENILIEEEAIDTYLESLSEDELTKLEEMNDEELLEATTQATRDTKKLANFAKDKKVKPGKKIADIRKKDIKGKWIKRKIKNIPKGAAKVVKKNKKLAIAAGAVGAAATAAAVLKKKKNEAIDFDFDTKRYVFEMYNLDIEVNVDKDFKVFLDEQINDID